MPSDTTRDSPEPARCEVEACDPSPDFDWVLPNLALGGWLPPRTFEHLADRYRIRRVVDMRAEECDDLELMTRHRVELLHLPTPDHRPVAQEMLQAGVAWTRAGLDRGDRVLIHCQHGIGRSALLACCVLVSLGHPPRDALERAKRARAKVCPSPEQLHAFLRWSADWYRANGAECPSVTWDDLARIAYRILADGTIATGDPR
jgi:Dual specificity phosphatase, catalytic domain